MVIKEWPVVLRRKASDTPGVCFVIGRFLEQRSNNVKGTECSYKVLSTSIGQPRPLAKVFREWFVVLRVMGGVLSVCKLYVCGFVGLCVFMCLCDCMIVCLCVDK